MALCIGLILSIAQEGAELVGAHRGCACLLAELWKEAARTTAAARVAPFDTAPPVHHSEIGTDSHEWAVLNARRKREKDARVLSVCSIFA